jgi:hypothetical protein
MSGTLERAPLVSFVPSNYMKIDINKPYIIKNGKELNNIEYLSTKYKRRNISRKRKCAPLVSFGLSTYTIMDLNKLYNIKNGAELTKIEYILTHSMSDISRM